MFISQTKREVLKALRAGPLDVQQIATALPLAPWYARETLKGMKRDRLVTDEMLARRIVWRLTENGAAALHAGDQLSMVPR
jgi:predicted transcriptional regulator